MVTNRLPKWRNEMGRIKSKKYAGVYLNSLENGDISYSVTYKDENNKLARYTVGKKSNGINEKYAYNKRAEFINKIKTGEDPLASKKKKQVITLNDLANTYFQDKAGQNKTNERQRGKYKLHISPVLGNTIINSINKDAIIKLQKSLLNVGKAAKTVNGTITLLKAIINYNIREKNLNIINPCTGIKNIKVDDKRDRYLTLDEVQQLINEIGDNKTVYHFVKLALLTGARLEGVLHIQKKDINLEDNSIIIHDLKSGGTYTGFFDDKYKKELDHFMKDLKVNHYIVGGQVDPIPGRTMRRWIKPVLDKLFNHGLKVDDRKNRVVIHTLRHTFASQLAIAGVPILTIQKLMNHADIDQTMRYAKLAPNQGREAVQMLYSIN